MSENAATYPVQESRFPQMLSCVYDFSEHGGAVGDIGLNCYLPPLTMITRGWIRQITAAASDGSATIALMFSSAGDVLAATAYDNAKFSGALAKTKQDDSITYALINDDESTALQLIQSIAGAALTAGKYEYIFECLPLKTNA